VINLYTKGAVTISNISFLPAEQQMSLKEAPALKDVEQKARIAGPPAGIWASIADDLSQVSGTWSQRRKWRFVSRFSAAALRKLKLPRWFGDYESVKFRLNQSRKSQISECQFLSNCLPDFIVVL
jgi:hypothetical protein